MGFWLYVLGWLLLATVLRQPWLVCGVAVLVLLRKDLPDPIAWVRAVGTMRSLELAIDLNPEDHEARCELARLYLDQQKTQDALELLNRVRMNPRQDPQLLYVLGLARLRAGDVRGALMPIAWAVDADPNLFEGEPLLVVGNALTSLHRFDEAAEAMERYVAVRGDCLEGWMRLAIARSAAGQPEQAREALQRALSAARPRGASFGLKDLAWWIRAQVGRFWI